MGERIRGMYDTAPGRNVLRRVGVSTTIEYNYIYVEQEKSAWMFRLDHIPPQEKKRRKERHRRTLLHFRTPRSGSRDLQRNSDIARARHYPPAGVAILGTNSSPS